MNCRLILVLGAFAAVPSARAQYLFNALAPCRLVDTRGTGNPITTTERDIQMTGGCGIPTQSSAFSINVTAIGASSTAANSLAVWPTGQPNQGLATLYFGHGAIPAGAVIAPAGTGSNSGKIALNTLSSASTTDVLIDVNGYFGSASGGLAFYPITPCRVVDTRSWAGKTGAFGPPSLAAYSGRDFPLSSPSAGCGVPTNAVAYSLNVTAVPQGTLSFLSIWKTGQPYPSVSTLNSPDGSMVANAAIVPAGTNGSVTVVAGNATDILMDVNGYFAPPGNGGLYFYPMPPCRVVDTRQNLGGTYLQAYSGKFFQIGGTPNGLCSVPTTAQAYSLNITAVPRQNTLDFLTVWPSGMSYPYVSTLNDTDGYTIANAAIVAAGPSSGIQMVAGYPTDVIADINGYFSLNASEGSYVNVTGARDIGSGPPGTPQQYTLHFTNTNADVVYGQVLFTTSSQLSGTYACQIEWNSAGNLNLISPNVNVDGSFGQTTPLSDTSIPCSVDASRSTKTQTGSGYDISLWITFASGFNGSSVQAFAYGENSQGLASLWLPTSSWVIGSWYYLSTQASPLGEGTVSPTPGWYSSGAQATVTATANPGYQFVNFTGDLSGSVATQTLSMNGPKTVTASFAPAAPAQNGVDMETSADPSCGVPECYWGTSVLTFTSAPLAVPVAFYGQSRTYSSGPYAGQYWNWVTDVVYDQNANVYSSASAPCSSASGGYQTAGSNPAIQTDPCNTSQGVFWVNKNVSAVYTAVGTHWNQYVADGSLSSSFNTYYALGLARAGASSNFYNVRLSTYRYFTYPATLTVSPSDGVGVSYTSQPGYSASIAVNVPYTAQKGRHLISFPSNDNHGNSGLTQQFEVFVYDDTPTITGVSPTALTPGNQTTLTVTGTGFGDHPTVYVGSTTGTCFGGTAYSAGAPSHPQTNQDSVSVSVTLPVNYSSSTVAVCLRSNGAGGQTFFGAPQGQQQGSPNSNTVQVQMQPPPPPTVSGLSGIWYFGTGYVPNNGYYDTTVLTVTPWAGGPAPSAGSPAVWNVVANAALVVFGCTDATCASIMLTAQGSMTSCDDAGLVKITASIAGVASAPFPLGIDTPNHLQAVATVDNEVSLTGQVGYISSLTYQLVSTCNQVMVHAAVNEEFTTESRSSSTANNWPFLKNEDPAFLHYWDTDHGFGFEIFTDTLLTSDSTTGGSLVPTPQIPGPKQMPPVPLSTTPLIWQTQLFRAGWTAVGSGVLVQIDAQNSYQDHGRNACGSPLPCSEIP